MQEFSPQSRICLDNAACAYCHKPFDASNRREEEHVIGRNFVPKGSLAAQWNLIVGSCRGCNDEKSKLENDLSAIIMRPDWLGRFEPDPRMLAEARRKETARSQRTGKAVRDSSEELTISGKVGKAVSFSANLVCGPQLDHERAYRLAFFHVAAFFYLITFDKGLRLGKPIPWTFAPIAVIARPDWGNEQLLGFQSTLARWHHRVHAIGADEYFKTVIRRAPENGQGLWAWAVEWNKNYRVIGFFGDGDAAQSAFEELPVLKKVLYERGINPVKGPYETWGRREVALANEDDHLFDSPAKPGS